MAKILIVEDDINLCNQVVAWLANEMHTVEAVHDGKEGSQRLRLYDYELAILDWQLPEMSGIEVCRAFRAEGGSIPILMLTGKTTIESKETGLDSGADDYLTKPFHMKELSARIRALLRRPHAISSNVLEVRGLALDTVQKRLKKNGEEIQLSPKEFALIEYFMRHPDQIFSQEALLEKVWSSESDATILSVYTTVKTLRKKIAAKDEPQILSTIHGMGYRLDSK